MNLSRLVDNFGQQEIDKKNLEIYSKVIEDYRENIHADQIDALYRDRFIENLKPGDSLLDYGCGAGGTALDLQNKGFNVVGVDVSQDFINIAKKSAEDRNSSVVFMSTDSRTLVREKKTFQGIVAEYSLIHIQYPAAQHILFDFNKLLDDRGCLYLALQENPEKDTERYKMTKKFHSESGYHSIPYRPELKLYLELYHQNHIENMLIRAGFSVENIEFRDPIENEFPFRKMFITARKKKSVNHINQFTIL